MRISINMGILALVHNIQPKNITTSRPGNVGSVGEVNVRTRFRQSNAEMPWSVDPYWTGSRAHKLGSNVQDGHSKSYITGNGPANTHQKGWNGNRSFKHQYGYSIHDLQSADLSTIPIETPQGRVSYKAKVARTRNVKAQGNFFLPMGYTATGKPRGGLYPTATSFGGTTPASQAYDPAEAPVVNLDPEAVRRADNPLQAGPTNTGKQPDFMTDKRPPIGNRLGNLRLF